MANLEKYVATFLYESDDSGFDQIPTRARNARVPGRNRNKPQARPERRLPDTAAQPVIIRLELEATPGNVARMEERVRRLNRELEESGAPVRLRMIN
ncbi:MAG TPA: hypothetical protein VN428_21185 [Bryobacteraceae bacterium]|nr:hypothetical protein [Bryobacteraceae bacterium]